MNKKPLSLAAIRRVATQLAERRFALGIATGLVLAASLLATVMACGSSAPTTSVTHGETHGGLGGVGESITGGEQIDTMIITDHLYLHGPGGTMFEIGVGKDANGRDVVTATPAG